jgi:hypothetical protein
MNTQEFVASLRNHADAPIIFDYGQARVPAGYHVTEVKAVNYQTMDCGGRSDAWSETIVQLWNPDASDKKQFMSAKKFLGIFERAASGVPVTSTAELKLEYGNETLPAINYHVGNLSLEDGNLIVTLEPPRVQCKARNRNQELEMSEPVVGCCTPSAENLSAVNSSAAKSGCC